MAELADPISAGGYSSTVRKVALVNGGLAISGTNPLPTGVYAPFTKYETKSASPGASQTNYDFKTAASAFVTVVTSHNTTIINNHATLSITVKLNSTANDSVTIKALQAMTFNVLQVTNIFITTPGLYNAAIDVYLFG